MIIELYLFYPELTSMEIINATARHFIYIWGCYRRLHLPVNACAKNMFSTDVKCLCFRCQTLKFPRPNLSLRDLKRLCFRYQTLKFRHISVIFAGFSHIF